MGTITDVRQNTYYYKVRLENSNREKWYKVEDIAALTRQAELDKREKVLKTRQMKKRMSIQQHMKSLKNLFAGATIRSFRVNL